MHLHRQRVSQLKHALVARTKEYIAGHLSDRVAVPEMARSLGVAPAYLTEAFRSIEGVPLYRYELHVRLAKALELLPKYDDLARLAQDLGFSSHSHFTTAFRRSFGDTPEHHRAHFRSQLRGDALAASMQPA